MAQQERLDWSRAERLVVQGDMQSLFQTELQQFINAATQPRSSTQQPSLEGIEPMWIRTKYDVPSEPIALREAPLNLKISDLLHPIFLSPADVGLAPPDPSLAPSMKPVEGRKDEQLQNVVQLLTENRLLPSRWLDEANRYNVEKWNQFFRSASPSLQLLDPGAELLQRLLVQVENAALGDFILAQLLPSYITQAQEQATRTTPEVASATTTTGLPASLKQLLPRLVSKSSLASLSALEVGSRIERLQLRRCGSLGVKCEMELAAMYFVSRTQAPPT